MSDASSAEMFASGVQWLGNHRRLYLASGGAEGHMVDLSFSGGKGLTPHLMLRTVGRKSGRSYVTVVLYGFIGGEVAIVASKGGADHHPAWYENLVAGGSEVRFQIATQAFRGTWREPQGAERDAIWEVMDGNYPTFVDYRASTARRIPIVLMKPVESIPAFTEADAG